MVGYESALTALYIINGILLVALLFAIASDPMKALAVLVFLILHPVEFIQVFWHASKNHHVEVVCVNFRFGAECEGCGRVFIDD